jgi:hypothetical protein
MIITSIMGIRFILIYKSMVMMISKGKGFLLDSRSM